MFVYSFFLSLFFLKSVNPSNIHHQVLQFCMLDANDTLIIIHFIYKNVFKKKSYKNIFNDKKI